MIRVKLELPILFDDPRAYEKPEEDLGTFRWLCMGEGSAIGTVSISCEGDHDWRQLELEISMEDLEAWGAAVAKIKATTTDADRQRRLMRKAASYSIPCPANVSDLGDVLIASRGADGRAHWPDASLCRRLEISKATLKRWRRLLEGAGWQIVSGGGDRCTTYRPPPPAEPRA
jgi:hypothetical protein